MDKIRSKISELERTLEELREMAIEPTIWSSEELRSAIRSGDYQDVIKYLPNMDKDTIGEADRYGQTALHWAIDDNEEICQMIIENMHMDDICHQTTATGSTALHFAVKRRRPQMVKLLLKYDVERRLVCLQNIDGETALHLAVSIGDLEMCQILYESAKSANVLSIQTKNGYTAPDLAIHRKHDTIVNLFQMK